MPAGIAATSAGVIDPIGNGDAITISRRAGGAVSSHSDRAADAVGERRAVERLFAVSRLVCRCPTRTPAAAVVASSSITIARDDAADPTRWRRAAVTSSGPASATTAAASSADADREQRQILEQVTANRGQPRRLEEPQRRERKALGPALDEDVDQDRRRDRGEREQRGRVQPEHGVPAPPRASRKLRSARSGGVSVTISEY